MKKDLNMQIGKRVRIKREEQKISRERLAESIEVSSQFLAQVELGGRGMSSATLYKICNALSTSADYIIMGKEESNDLSCINKIMSKLDPKYLPYAEDILRAFVLSTNK